MENTEQKKVEVDLPADLAKRFAEAKDAKERNAVLAEFATRQGAEEQTKREAAVMSGEQFDKFLERMGQVSAENAKLAVAEIAGKVERRYGLSEGEAKEIAERSFVSAEQKQRNLRADMEVAAKVFRGMLLARQGKPHEYTRAVEEEADYYKRTYGRQTRAMGLGTDSTGGYLAPTLFSDMLYENIARTSLVRKFATIIPMNGNEIINIPTLTTDITASTVAEATTVSGVQPVFSQKQLTTKKIITKTRPISAEMIEKAHPSIVQILLDHASMQIRNAEDSAVFGTSGNGIRNTSTNLVTVGSVATSATDYSSLDFDSMLSLESELTAEYLAGDDIQGSGIIGGAPQYWLPHKLVQVLKGKKDGMGQYLEECRELRNNRKIFGYNTQRVLSLPDGSSLAAADKVGVFGNLGHVWCGVEAGFRILIADQGVTDNGGSDVNLFDTAQVAIRVMEMFDSVVIDPEAFAIASMGA